MYKQNDRTMIKQGWGVSWEDVFEWLDEIADTYGWYGDVQVSKPVGKAKGRRAVVSITFKQMRYDSPQEGSKKTVWKHAETGGKSVEAVALELAVDFDAKLERQAWSAERAAADALLI